MTIQPLGNLLSQHEEHGIWINRTTIATGLFFADDSTLLSETIHGVLKQLELVQVYCDGSGAKLNLNKSTLLSLNRLLPLSLPVEQWSRINSFFRLRLHGTIVAGATPDLGSVFLLPTQLVPRCVCYCADDKVDMEGL
uniref:AlNc14C15G1672 protein n=1 Tax=Albugo laibachii Nc14 TaxID=890382 RepID=F0W3X1_9STRA|nr:AlNc14C15G1672 [Albugo laibachii Nc14]|eukprot:CCA15766.1 AlNc14C15G1672 [Albugo laibachii Nc14]